MKTVFATAAGVALAASAAAGLTVSDYLFGARGYPESVARSVALAEIERERVSKLVAEEAGGVVIVLPVNEAWDSATLNALLSEEEGNWRYNVLLAAAAPVPRADAGSFAALAAYAARNGGIIDSAYGTSYFVRDNRVCLAEWAAGNYVEGDCANVVGSPVVLDDGAVYFIDRVILPGDIEDGIEALIARRRRRML